MPYASKQHDGCPIPSGKSPNADLSADSTISTMSHEQMESVTDPELSTWYDANGNEIGDKCAWNFGKLVYDGGRANEKWNGHYYIVQQEWSNRIDACT